MAYINGKEVLFGAEAHITDGTNNYNELENKPTINGAVLEGNKSLKDLGILNAFYITDIVQLAEIAEKLESGDKSFIPCVIFCLKDFEEQGIKKDTIIFYYADESEEVYSFTSSITDENFTKTDKNRIDEIQSFKFNYERYHTQFGLLEKTNNVYDKINNLKGIFGFDAVKPNHFIFNVEISAGTQTVSIYHNDKSFTNTFDVSSLSENEAVSGTIEMFLTGYLGSSNNIIKGVYAKATFRNSKGELNLYSDKTSNSVTNTPNIEVGTGVRVISAYGKRD